MSTSDFFSDRFEGPWDDEAIRFGIAVRAVPLCGLEKLAPAVAASRIRDSLRLVVVPTDQMISVIRELIGIAKAYCDRAYSDEIAVLRLIYGSAPAPSNEDGRAICLTGLAGVGKSVVFESFCRLFSETVKADIRNHACLELVPCWRVRIRDRASLSSLIQPFFRDRSLVRPHRTLDVASSEAAAQGVALVLADEFQFITSSEANSLMAKLLLQLTQIGPPIVYACNFSMVSALQRRPQQDRDRLLLDPIIVLPDQLGPDWSSTVAECLNVAEELSLLSTQAATELLHDYSFGIKRHLRALLVRSYLQMRIEGKRHVTLEHVCTAYRSIEYSTMRATVEELALGVVTRTVRRSGLYCPFPKATVPHSGVTTSGAPDEDDRAKEVAESALVSMLSPDAIKVLNAIERQGDIPPPPKGRAPRRPQASSANLIGGAERFANRKSETNPPAGEGE